MAVKYTFSRGETISLALDVTSGDVSEVSGIVAHMRARVPGRPGPDPASASAATFSVSARPSDTPPGWTLTIDAATSKGIAAGIYCADARLTIAGGVVIPDAVMIEIVEPATVV